MGPMTGRESLTHPPVSLNGETPVISLEGVGGLGEYSGSRGSWKRLQIR
jgi:hypothetical protein